MGPRLHRLRPLAITFVLGFLLAALTPFPQVFSSGGESPAFLFTSAPTYDALAWVQGGERFSSGATLFVKDARGSHKLLPNFAASTDPSVSFDGKRVLLAGKQSPHEHWQIWEVDVTSSPNSTPVLGSPRRVTDCADDCIRPFYLPDERWYMPGGPANVS